MGTKNKLLLNGFLLLVCLMAGAYVGFYPLTNKQEDLLAKQIIPQDSQIFSSFDQFKTDPDVGSVKEYSVSNSVGTAILIPQIHRYPGSNLLDSINDLAEKTQNQIFNIVSDLSKMGTKMAMIEGDLFGKVSDDKISRLEKKYELRNKFSDQAIKIEQILEKGSGPDAANLFKQSADQYLSSVDRELILEGAPLTFKIKGGDLDVYGSEIAETQNKCADIVRDLTYLQDAEKEKTANTAQTNQNKIENIMSVLKSLSDTNAKNVQNAQLQNIIANSSDADLKQAIGDLNKTYKEIADNNASASNSNITTSSPSRTQNPYMNLTLKQIEEKIKQGESDVNEFIIDKRNKEAAINFAKLLKDGNYKSGIIEFGAGHEQGLVSELNKQNISVVVITPEEVTQNPVQ